MGICLGRSSATLMHATTFKDYARKLVHSLVSNFQLFMVVDKAMVEKKRLGCDAMLQLEYIMQVPDCFSWEPLQTVWKLITVLVDVNALMVMLSGIKG